jgi:predicted pyridoxine 5'-phosphate oxidase superfamily flavin-nucleotide-binding protein
MRVCHFRPAANSLMLVQTLSLTNLTSYTVKNESLRVHGTGSILVDDALCQSFTSRGRPALLVLRVEVTECFFHCGKAFIRSDCWNPATWSTGVLVSFGAEIATNLKPDNEAEFVKELDRFVDHCYRTDL